MKTSITTMMGPGRRHLAVAALLGLSLLGTPAFAAAPADAAKAAKPATAPGDAKAFVEKLHHDLEGLVGRKGDLATLHKAIGEAMNKHMDYEFMARRILSKHWAGLKQAQKDEFLGLLRKMVEKTYVKRFKPGNKVKVRYEDRIRAGKKGRVQVRSTIKVKRTSADVWYSLRPADGAWKIYDIVVDEASQLRTYKRSFGRVLKKDGWDALIAKMKKSANRK